MNPTHEPDDRQSRPTPTRATTDPAKLDAAREAAKLDAAFRALPQSEQEDLLRDNLRVLLRRKQEALLKEALGLSLGASLEETIQGLSAVQRAALMAATLKNPLGVPVVRPYRAAPEVNEPPAGSLIHEHIYNRRPPARSGRGGLQVRPFSQEFPNSKEKSQ
jgi:hypothetical protein